MASNPPSEPSIFQDGKIKPGVYKIQNVQSQTYLDVLNQSTETCCRPDGNLEGGRGLWEIKSLGAGHSVQRVSVEPGKPDQFLAPLEGINNGTSLSVGAYPVAWRIEIVDDDRHRGLEHVCVYWGNTKSAWDLHHGLKENGTKVNFWAVPEPAPQEIWKFVPIKTDGGVVTTSPLAKSPSNYWYLLGLIPLPIAKAPVQR